MCGLFRSKHDQEIEDRKELLKWFSPKEVLWLQQAHPHLAHKVADPKARSQLIFEAQEIIDNEFH